MLLRVSDERPLHEVREDNEPPPPWHPEDLTPASAALFWRATLSFPDDGLLLLDGLLDVGSGVAMLLEEIQAQGCKGDGVGSQSRCGLEEELGADGHQTCRPSIQAHTRV